MKRLNAWLNRFRTIQPLYAHLARDPGVGVRELHGRPAWGTPTGAPPANVAADDWRRFVRNVASERAGDDRTAGWVLAGLAADGVKAFSPTAAEFDALSHVTLNVSWTDYRQPFGTFLVLVPDDLAYGMPVGGRPAIAVIMRVDPESRVLGMLVVTDDPNHAAHSITCWPADGDTSIEETFRDHEVVRLDDAREESAFDRCRRAALNACLAITQFGTRRLGYANPEYAERLSASLLKRKVPDRLKEANRTALLLVPDCYGIRQDVRLHDTEGGTHERGVDPAGDRRPHWRRGHWRNQHCGPRGGGRQLVFIRPVLIYAHRFAGDRGETVAA